MPPRDRCACGDQLTRAGCPRCGAAPPAWANTPTLPHVPLRASPPTGTPVAPTVPGFEILNELGRGGMGVVYRARQTALGREVALKMILAGSHAGPRDRERFRREAEAVAALQHPHVVQIFEIGEHNGQPYLALEYVPGGTLADRLLGSPWPAADAAALVELLARAVQSAHDRGIVHRDLKPANVLLGNAECGMRNAESKSGDDEAVPLLHSAIRNPHSELVPKLTDFGLAKRVGDDGGEARTGTGAVVGTPSYIAPEQADGGREVGPAADVYSLGAILYELLTGRPPFHGSSPLETVMQVLKDDPVPPSRLRPKLPRDLETIALTCLHKNPARRYDSAGDLADDLRRFRGHETIHARPASAAVRFGKWAKRHPALAVLGGTSTAAAVALVAVLGVAYVQVRDAVRQKDEQARAAESKRVEAEQARADAERETKRADELRKMYEELAEQNARGRTSAEKQAQELSDRAETQRRSLFALQLSQVAAVVERNPARALALLTDPDKCPERLREFTWHHLRRLCDREERTYGGHAGGLLAVAASPDGALVATAAREADAVRLWEPKSGTTRGVLTDADGVLCLAFSPDGNWLAAGCEDGTVRLWRFAACWEQGDCTPARTIPAHAGAVSAVAYHPDGGTLASGGADGKVKWWLTGTKSSPRRDRSAAAHPGGVTALAFAPTGLLVSGGADRTAKLWPAGGGEPVTLDRHADAVRAVAVSPDGRTVATVDNGETPAVILWDVASRGKKARLTGAGGLLNAVAFSPDGFLLAAGGIDAAVRIWDADGHRDRGTLTGHTQSVRGLTFTPDSRSVVSASADRTARVWQARPAAADTARPQQDAVVTAAAAARSGKLLVTGDAGGRTRAWRTDAGEGRVLADPLFETSEDTGPVQAIAVALTDDQTVLAAAAGPNGLVLIRQLPGRRPTGVRVGPPRDVSAVEFSADGRFLAAADADGVMVWSTVTGRPAAARPLVPTAGVKNLTFLPSRLSRLPVLAVAHGSAVQLVDLAGRTLAEGRHADGRRVSAVAADPDGRFVASADADGTVKVWDVRPSPGGLALAERASAGGHTDAVAALAFAADGRTLASVGRDRSVVLWDPVTGQERAALTGPPDALVEVAFAAGDTALWAVARDGTIARWRADLKKTDTPFVVPQVGAGDGRPLDRGDARAEPPAGKPGV